MPDEDAVWDVVAFYLAQLCANLVLVCSPEVIVLGGGVSERQCLYPKVQEQLLDQLNGYIQSDKLTVEGVKSFVVPPTYAGDAGITSALSMALAHVTPSKDGEGEAAV